MKRRSFLQYVIAGLTALFVPKSEAKVGGQILARLDCGRTDCKHYGGLGCHGSDDPANQTSCKLNLKQGTECLNSKGTLFYEASELKKARERLEKTLQQKDLEQQFKFSHLFNRQILDMCDCRDYLYVLLEGGELWRAWEGGEYFGKPFLTWQMVHQYIWHAKMIFERSPGLLVGVEFDKGRLLYCGEYYVKP